MKYLAHKVEEKEQLLSEHLYNTAELCSKFAKNINMSNYAEIIGYLHDIGKYSNEFQRRINGENIEVDHSTAGAKEAFERKFLMAALCVSGHHCGLPNLGNRTDIAGCPTLLGRMKKSIENYDNYKKENKDIFERNIEEPRFKNNLDYFFMLKFLFSCLVDADYLDTESFILDEQNIRNNEYSDINTLLNMLNQYVQRFKTPKTKLDILRNNVFKECEKIGSNSKEKLFTLTVPTGGGKTISSMAFALNYAAVNHKERIIYVIPYTSIIDQNAKIFKEILGAENILENHSNISFNQDPNKKKKILASENWDAPIIVTTAVQFFETLFSNKPSKCRKIHNMSNSIIIFDEIQTLPVDYLSPCVSVIYELITIYNSSVVLCTATQPNLSTIFTINGLDVKPVEICDNIKNLETDFKRTNIKYEGKLTDSGLVERLKKHNQVLCIVNTKAHAQNLYMQLGRSEENFHLSAYMSPYHRKKVIAMIKKRLLEGKTCRVISTSLIEAGVDIDFPTVYRAIAGLDSVLQAGGRCNRESHRKASESIVHVFDTNNILKCQELNVSVFRQILKNFRNKIDSPQAINEYFNILYYYKDINNTYSAFDKKGILDNINKLASASIAQDFKIIENETKTVYILTEKNKKIIEELKKSNYTKHLFKKLQQDSVNIYENDLNKLLEIGAIEVVDEDFFILTETNVYDKSIGIVIP